MCDKSGEIIMGVGNGGGNLFVKGDYDSITTLQNKLFELENLRREVAELREEVSTLRLNQSMPLVPKYPGQDVIWCTTSSIDTGNLPAKGF